MAEGAELLRLMTWLSPAFPVGAFAYSHGLERAIEERLVRDRPALTAWLRDLVQVGSGWTDAVLLAEAWRASSLEETRAIVELGIALAGSRERHLETTQQGEAFGQAMQVWAGEAAGSAPRSWSPLSPPPERSLPESLAANSHPPHPEVPIEDRPRRACPGPDPGTHDGGTCLEDRLRRPPQHEEGGRSSSRPGSRDEEGYGPAPYPVAVGFAARRHGIALEAAMPAYLHAFASNLIQASVRLVPLGQRDGVATLAGLEPLLLATARRAAALSLDDLGSCTVMSEIMSMRHETQYSRVFRT